MWHICKLIFTILKCKHIIACITILIIIIICHIIRLCRR
nr:MAG TPA: hypothetical protein [Caudoviricetes sp.]DAR97045.1 MAG TPA: hypothetical protein [Caudoviricetes sp.]